MMVLMALVTTFMTGPLLALHERWKRKAAEIPPTAPAPPLETWRARAERTLVGGRRRNHRPTSRTAARAAYCSWWNGASVSRRYSSKASRGGRSAARRARPLPRPAHAAARVRQGTPRPLQFAQRGMLAGAALAPHDLGETGGPQDEIEHAPVVPDCAPTRRKAVQTQTVGHRLLVAGPARRMVLRGPNPIEDGGRDLAGPRQGADARRHDPRNRPASSSERCSMKCSAKIKGHSAKGIGLVTSWTTSTAGYGARSTLINLQSGVAAADVQSFAGDRFAAHQEPRLGRRSARADPPGCGKPMPGEVHAAERCTGDLVRVAATSKPPFPDQPG